MIKKYAFISDFDGTITNDDFFTLISEKYFNDEMLAPWRAYLNGSETHFNALNQMFQQIHIEENELKEFISKIHVDPSFDKTAALCFEKNIPIYICSAGCDYYIKELLAEEIKKYNIKVITNQGVYDKEHGLRMIAPAKETGLFDEKVGVSKKNLVQMLKDEGYTTIFAGDGPPDIAPARISDVVFAKKILLKKCLAENITTEKFIGFNDIYDYIKGI